MNILVPIKVICEECGGELEGEYDELYRCMKIENCKECMDAIHQDAFTEGANAELEYMTTKA